jgi:dipeptidyl aminopeptidase/acylaminoacyl peptidase
LRRALLALLLAGPAPAAAQQRTPLTVEDLLAVGVVGDPQVSPDGKRVAFTVSTPSLQENRNISRVRVVPMEGGAAREIPGGKGSDRAPRWAPDGTLHFISTREGDAQIWREPAGGGEPTKLTALESGVEDFWWGPDANSLIFVADVKWPANQELDRRQGEFPTEARLWTHLFYRHWDEWRAGRRKHVFRYDVASRTATDLTSFDRDVPTLALGGHDVAVAPDGRRLALVFNPDSTVALSTNNDVFLIDARGSAPRAVTTSKANDHSPAWSPDGRRLAYLAMEVPGFESDRQQLVVYDPMGGTRASLTPDWPYSVAAFAWASDGRSLIAQVEERGEVSLYRIAVPGGRRTRIVRGGMNTAPQVSPRGGSMVFLRQSATAPPELWRAALDGRDARPLTRVNDELLRRLDLPPLEPFGFVGARGDSVFGWTLTPPGFDRSRRYPLVYLIHGGPQSAWLNQWHQRWSYHLFAARGYVVAAVNFHGSTGYGQEFTNSISRNWGGLPYEDLMKGIDVLVRRPYVDAGRLGAAGASYGGYMIFWMAGQTDRFRAMVAHDGVFNPVSMFGTTEELWFPTHEFGGTPMDPEARAVMDQWSPANHVAKWSTPMLVVHGQQDFRVDVSEGAQAFTALRLRDVPAKFLYFPDEGHWVLKPRNRRLWWSTVLDWLDTHLNPATP